MPNPAPDPSSPLAIALRYAASGLRVLPIKPGTKRPPMREWVEAATVDTDIIRNWFTGIYKDHGVGLAMGRQPDGRMIFALDVDEHDPAHSGSETLVDLQAEHGSLPDTVTSITGSNGVHHLFVAPADIEVRNGVAGDGLDIRGEGGQIVVAPSVHPDTGALYEWEADFAPWEHEIVDAPDWLLDLVREPEPVAPAAPAPTLAFPEFNDPDSPAEWLRSWWQWEPELRRAGWVEHHVTGNGDIHWTRPGKERRHGESAVLHPGGPFVVFSTDASMTGLRAAGRLNRDGSVSLSPFEFFAAYNHDGDLSAAARFLGSQMPGSTDSRLSVPAIDAEDDPLAGYMAQKIDWPSFYADDHTGEDWLAEPLIPAGRLVALYAPAKQGKSEVALAVTAALAAGRPILGQRNTYGPRNVIYLDYEMTKADLWERLELFGYSDPDELAHLHYWPLPSLPPLDTPEGAWTVRGLAARCAAEAVVIDTMGRAVDGDENSNDTYRAFARHTGLALKSDEVAVLRTDHAGKDRDKGQRGASAKNDDADVVFRVDRTDSGWKLSRTHTRIGWVPESTLIDRTVRGDGTLKIELSPHSVTYIAGTGDYVKELKAAGFAVTPGSKKKDLVTAAKAAGLSKSSTAMGDAFKFMMSELPKFSDGPTPLDEPADSRLSPDIDKGDVF